MKRNVTTLFVAILLCALSADRAIAADSYDVDPGHSYVVFRIGHLGVSNNWGRFDSPTGKIVIDDADPSKSSVEVEVKTQAVDTGNKKRDDHLRSPDFFNAKQFPTIGFKSDSIKKLTDGKYEVSGKLTLHGQTRPLTVTLDRVGAADTQMGSRAGFDTNFTIKRSDFGMDKMVGPVGDEVTLWISLEGVKK